MTRASLLSTQLDLYENYWDLTQGTTYSGTASRNPCKRRQQLGLSNTYFTHNSTEQSPFPTDQGWFSLERDTYVFAENVDLSNTHQFTVEFEMFLIEPNYYIMFYLNQDWSDFGRYIIFRYYKNFYCFFFSCYTVSGTETNIMSYTTTGINLSMQTWYKFYIVFNQFDSNIVNVDVYSKQLVSNSSSSIPLYSYTISRNVSYYMPIGNTINLSIKNAKNFVTSTPEVCALLSYNNYANCSRGYALVEYFCVDKCGDGIVQTPQTIQ